MKTDKENNIEEKIKVSIIMPAYNAEAYLTQAITSVQNQTYDGAWELLVIDDASKDHTEDVVRTLAKDDARIRYFKQPANQGVAAARNCGIKEAKGSYVAFLDADDWWDEKKLEIQMDCIRRTGTMLCYTGRGLVSSDGTPTGRVISAPERVSYRMLLKTNVIPCGSVVMKTEAAKEFGFTHDEYHEDYILWLNVLKKYGEAYGVAGPYLKCRLSAGGKSRNKLKSAQMQYGSYRCMGYGRLRAFYYMMFYTVHGILKYYG